MTYEDSPSAANPNGPHTVMMYAYYYPPCVCFPTAAARAAGFARQLHLYGWDPVVITRDLVATPCRCQVRRLPPDDPSALVPDYGGVVLLPTAITASGLRKARDRLALKRGGWFGRPIRALLRRAATATLNATENHDTWLQDGIRAGEHLMSKRNVDAVWTTSGPHRSISIGRHFAKRRGIPWIADLRDAISRLPVSEPKVAVPSYLKRRRFAMALRMAKRVVEVTPQERVRDLRWLSGTLEVIPSGFDPSDWTPIHSNRADSQARSRGHFVIAYTGHIVSKQDPVRFFEGLRLFVEAGGQRIEIRVDYYGPSGVEFVAAAGAAEVDSLVHDHGMISPGGARVAMAEADALLLLSYPGVSGVPGGKLYDYVASLTPVLLVPAGDGYTEGVLASDSAGLAASTPEEIAKALEVLALKVSGDQASSFSARVEMHGWSKRAQRLGELLDEVVLPQ